MRRWLPPAAFIGLMHRPATLSRMRSFKDCASCLKASSCAWRSTIRQRRTRASGRPSQLSWNFTHEDQRTEDPAARRDHDDDRNAAIRQCADSTLEWRDFSNTRAHNILYASGDLCSRRQRNGYSRCVFEGSVNEPSWLARGQGEAAPRFLRGRRKKL